MELKRTNVKKPIIEVAQEFERDGTKFMTVTVNGRFYTYLGYVSEADKEAGLKALQKSLDNNGGNVYGAMAELATMCNLGDNEVIPDKEIDLNGRTILISFTKMAAYDQMGNLLVDLSDLDLKGQHMPEVAIEALLVERIKNLPEDDYDDYDDEDFDDEDEDNESVVHKEDIMGDSSKQTEAEALGKVVLK